MISVVINTCAGSKDSETLARVATFGNPGKRAYRERADKLRLMLRRYAGIPGIDVVVAGEWYDGPGWFYVEEIGATKSPMDPPSQREAGAALSVGDPVVFLNDDHYVRPEDLLQIPEQLGDADVGAFINRRLRRADGSEQPLETGWKSYMMGHACVMTRKALDAVPWRKVPLVIQQDVTHTVLLKDAGMKFAEISVPVWDIEIGELP